MNKVVAAVARETREISLLLYVGRGASSFSPSAFDDDCQTYEDTFSVRDECYLDPERQEEGKGPLNSLNAIREPNNRTSVLLAKAYVLYSLREPRLALGLLQEIDYDSTPQPPSVHSSHISAPTSAFGSLGSSSGATTLGTALSRTGTLAGSVGVTELSKRLDGEVGDGKVWAVIERARGRCLQGAKHNEPGGPVLTQSFSHGPGATS